MDTDRTLSRLKAEPPLIVYEKPGVYTQEIVYEKPGVSNSVTACRGSVFQ